MRTYNNIFGPAIEVQNIKACILEASKNGKMKKRCVREVIENIDEESEKVHDIMKNHSTVFKTYELCEIREGIKRKRREIAKPHFKYDQMIQHVLISQIRPIVMKSLYEYAHGSLKNCGPLQTAQAISKWLRKDPKGTRYCLQMDVHHCYPSVDQDILIERWHQKVKDADFNIENDKVIRASPFGLAPGSPTSVWHIHFLFTPFDHWLSQQDGVEYSIRHMDDIIAFGPNKKKLHKVERDSIEYMKREYNMEINHNHQVFPIEWKDRKGEIHGRPLDVCGYLFYRDKTIMRKSHMIRTTRKAAKMDKKERITFYDAEQLLSHLGWYEHADMYDSYLKYIKPKANVKQLKRMVSKHSRKENERNEMENRNRLQRAAGGGGRENDGLPQKEHHRS